MMKLINLIIGILILTTIVSALEGGGGGRDVINYLTAKGKRAKEYLERLMHEIRN
jgi:hypothetical protein